MKESLVLSGINGGNPLGFLSATGTLSVAQMAYDRPKLRWELHFGAWRPVLEGCTDDAEAFLDVLFSTLSGLSLAPFEIEQRLPFPVATFRRGLDDAQKQALLGDRRMADVLSSFGDECCPEEDMIQETALRMVRSRDSAGQGLLAYALNIRRAVTRSDLYRSLFVPWDYADDGSSLRWDPLEDQSYALRADNPAKSTDRSAPRTMRGANALALEAMTIFPVFSVRRAARTTGYKQEGKQRSLSWPLWSGVLDLDGVRSLISLESLQTISPDSDDWRHWEAMGILAVFRSEVVSPNKYYKNFSPAVPV